MNPSSAILGSVARHLPAFKLTAPPELLAGGNLNHVWRLRSGSETLILKYAPPYVGSNPDISLSSARLDFEAKAFALFQEGGRLHGLASDSIRPPRLVAVDTAEHFILMEDIGGAADFSTSIASGSIPAEVGHELGVFIGRLHAISASDPFFASAFDNHPVQEARLRIQYLAVESIARAAGVSPTKRLVENASALGHLLLAPGRCLVMGDLWPPSILPVVNGLRLIDWEFAHFGHPLQDVAHFGAHCWMQAHAAGTSIVAERWRDLWKAFATAYCETTASSASASRKVDDERLMNIHAGAEILMRCAGPFVRGYCYDGLSSGHRHIREAVDYAVRLLDEPPSRFFEDISFPLPGR